MRYIFLIFLTPAESIKHGREGISGRTVGLERPWAQALDAVEVGYPADMHKRTGEDESCSADKAIAACRNPATPVLIYDQLSQTPYQILPLYLTYTQGEDKSYKAMLSSGCQFWKHIQGP